MECNAEQAMKCSTERPFRRQYVYCDCLKDWFVQQQRGRDFIEWSIEAPTHEILLEGVARFFPNRPIIQVNTHKEDEEKVANSRWVATL